MKVRYLVDTEKKLLEKILVLWGEKEYELTLSNPVLELERNGIIYRFEVDKSRLRIEEWVGDIMGESLEINHKEVCGYEFTGEEN